MLPETHTLREREMHARLVNWGIAMRGGLPGFCDSDGDFPSPNELDAQIIERGMVAMRRDRHLHYKLLKYLHVRGKSDQEATNYFRKSEKWVQDRHKEGISWLIRWFAGPIDTSKSVLYGIGTSTG